MWSPPNKGKTQRVRVYEALKGSAAAGGYSPQRVGKITGMHPNNCGRFLRALCKAGLVRSVMPTARVGIDYIRLDEVTR